MNKDFNRDYTNLTQIAKLCGMVPFTGPSGKVMEGFYVDLKYGIPIDLSACGEDVNSVYRTVIDQMGEIITSLSTSLSFGSQY